MTRLKKIRIGLTAIVIAIPITAVAAINLGEQSFNNELEKQLEIKRNTVEANDRASFPAEFKDRFLANSVMAFNASSSSSDAICPVTSKPIERVQYRFRQQTDSPAQAGSSSSRYGNRAGSSTGNRQMNRNSGSQGMGNGNGYKQQTRTMSRNGSGSSRLSNGSQQQTRTQTRLGTRAQNQTHQGSRRGSGSGYGQGNRSAMGNNRGSRINRGSGIGRGSANRGSGNRGGGRGRGRR